MRRINLALLMLLGLAGCKQSPPVVNVNTVPGDTGTTFAAAYQITEGSSLDLVIDQDNPSATITTTDLPKNAAVQNGIFTFTPDYSQAGLYSITFTITAGTIDNTSGGDINLGLVANDESRAAPQRH